MSCSLVSRIGVVQVAGAIDTPALRGRLGGLLRRLEPPPNRLPPSAVLLVRQLEDPAPGTLAVRAGAADADWCAALHRRLEQCARRAARPRHGLVPSDAEAVLFEDESELRACLTLALLRGRQASWWCRLPLQHYGAQGTRFASLVAAEPRQLPETWSQLASWLQPDELVRAISASEARQLIALMLAERGLSRLTAPLRLDQATPQLVPAARLSPALAFWRELFDRPAHVFSQPAHWAAQPAVLLLLTGLAEALQRQHFRLRQPSFAIDLAAWWRELTQPIVEEPPSPSQLAGTPKPVATSAPERGMTPLDLAPPGPRRGPVAGESRADSPAKRAALVSRDASTTPSVDPLLAPPQPPAAVAAPALDLGAPAFPANTPTAPAAPEPARALQPVHAGDAPSLVSAAPMEPEALEPGERVFPGWETLSEWGGLFFLINAMTSLGLPDASDEHPLWGLGPWAQLELLARGLLEPLDPELGHDPLWRLLAQLDDRAADVPLGREQAPLPEAPLPATWTAALGPAVPAAPLAGPPSPLLAQLPPAWSAVARRCAAFLRCRLACSGIGTPELAGVFHKPARIYLSRSHLDVVFALEDVSLPARIAGLDKNPGWLPSFGKVIGFHYH